MMASRICFETAEVSARADVTGAVSGEGLPAADRDIDVERVDLESKAASTGALGCYDGGATAEETVEDHVAPSGAVQDRIGDHGHRLHSGVPLEQIAFISASTDRARATVS